MEGICCPRCNLPVEPGLSLCPRCGGRPVPVMVVVTMPFVVSGERVAIPEEIGEFLDRDGDIDPSQSVGCQLYPSSGSSPLRLISSEREEFLRHAEAVLPRHVQETLSRLVFYRIPEPEEIRRISQEVEEVPTDLFLRIQEVYDPDYLFLPEVDAYLFRHPRFHGGAKGPDAAFAFVHLTAYLLDNRENRIASRGSGYALERFPLEEETDENPYIPVQDQLKLMEEVGKRAVERLLRAMKMT